MLDLTLRGLLAQVEAGAVVLPAMQRPFVWDETRISRLIDSLLRGFPVGAVMLWGTSSVQRYRRVARDVDTGTDQIYAFEKSTGGTKYLVLDGQQRLTSLFIAFYGTYDSKHLHLDVLSGDPVNNALGSFR